MKKIKINIANKSYTVELAETAEDHELGLQDIEQLPKDKGMLFVFDEPQDVSFWMKDTYIPLDLAFLNEDLEVTQVFKGIPESEELMEGFAAYVLEVNSWSGIKIGDELNFEPEDRKLNSMHVLDSNGNSQMELQGGERIFSRANTKTLIKFAKKAASTNNDNDFRALGKRVFKFLATQDSNEPQYVESKK